MPLDPKLVKELFIAALNRATLSERAAYLDEACAGNAGLRARLETLLSAHQNDRFLEQPAVGLVPPRAPETKALATPPDRRADRSANDAPDEDDRAALVLDFLMPSTEPGSLGRLGHYEVLEVIGRGGMGVVFKALDTSLRRVVAVKVLAPELAGNATDRKRFVREARAAAAVAHEHVVPIHAVEEGHRPPYLVMQYVAGVSLEDKLQARGYLTLTEILRIGMQTAQGLAAAHQQGLVHRDIKPANILLENGVERVRITDFGLARAGHDASLTQSGFIAGTPMYMSPEQASSGAIDHRSDLFSLGSVLYAMGTGHPPFRASSAMAALRRVCDDTPHPIRQINPEIPEFLAAIIARLHAKDPAERFQSAQAVADVLARHLAELQQPLAVAAADLPPTPVATRVVRAGAAPARRRRWRLGSSVAILALAALAGGAYLAFHGIFGGADPSDPEPANPTAGAMVAPTPLKDPFLGRRREDIPAVLLTLAGGGDPARAPSELVAVLADSRFRPRLQGVNSVRYSPNGRYLASAAVNPGNVYNSPPDVTIWDAATGRERHTLKGHEVPVENLIFSPDSKRLASASRDRTVRIWDVESGRQLLVLPNDEVVRGIAFSPDGKLLAATNDLAATKVWDLAKAEIVVRFQGHERGAFDLVWSADGKRIATCGNDGTARVWNADTGEELTVCRGHDTPTLRSLAFSPDGRRIVTAAVGDPVARVWDAATGRRVLELKGHAHSARQVAWSADGSRIATGGEWGDDVTVRLWDAQTAAQIASYSGHSFAVTTLSFHPDGKRLASGAWDGTVRIWDLAAAKEVYPRVGHTGEIHAVAVSPDARTLASGGQDRTVKLWDLAAWSRDEPAPPVRTLNGHTDRVRSLVFSRDGKQLVSGGADGSIVLWDVAGGQEVERWAGGSKASPGVALSPDGRTVAAIGQNNRTIKRWDEKTGNPMAPLPVSDGPIGALAIQPDGGLLAWGGGEGTVILYHPDGAARAHEFEVQGKVNCVAFSPDGALLAAATAAPDAALYCWDVATHQPRGVLRGHHSPITRLAFQPATNGFATSDANGFTQLWQIPRNGTDAFAPSRVLEALSRDVQFDFTPDGGYLATADPQGLITVLRVPRPPPDYKPGPPEPVPEPAELAMQPNPADPLRHEDLPVEVLARAGQGDARKAPAGLVAVFHAHKGQVRSVAISPDGKTLASGGDDATVYLSDMATAKLKHELAGHQQPVMSVSFSPDGKLLASCGEDALVKLWDAGNGKELRTLTGHQGKVMRVAFSPDGKTLASTGVVDGTVRVWDVKSGTLRSRFLGTGVPYPVVFSPDGKTLASGHSDGVIRLWDLAAGWQVGELRGHWHTVRGLAFHPAGQVLVSTSDDGNEAIRVWDLGTLGERQRLLGHRGNVLACVWRADGRLLTTSSWIDGTVRLWDAAPPKTYCKPLQAISIAAAGSTPAHGRLHDHALSPEGRYVATANPDGTVYLLRLAGPGEVLQAAP